MADTRVNLPDIGWRNIQSMSVKKDAQGRICLRFDTTAGKVELRLGNFFAKCAVDDMARELKP